MAEYLDEVEATKQAAETAEKSLRLDKLAAKFETATGEALAPSLRNKLANLDPEALDTLIKVSQNNNSAPEALGTSADIADKDVPGNIKEAAVRADENFLNWVLGD